MKLIVKYRLLRIIILFFIVGCSTSRLIMIDTPPDIASLTEEIQPEYSSHDELKFLDFIQGVNTVIVVTNPEFENTFSFDDHFSRKYFSLMKGYVQSIGIKNVAITADEHKVIKNEIPLQQRFTLELNIDRMGEYLTKLRVNFKTCNGDEFRFSNKMDYYIDDDWHNLLYEHLKGIYWAKSEFNPKKSLKIKRIITEWNEGSLKKYLIENSSDNIEGIYEKYGIVDLENDAKYKIAIIKNNKEYDIIYLSGAKESYGWIEGELKGSIDETSLENFYKVNWIMSNKSLNKNVYLTTDKKSILDFDFLNHESSNKIKYLKIFPTHSSKLPTAGNYISSGTGFIISKDGLIITNNHIVKNYKNISVEFKTGSSTIKYLAEIVLNDRKNDIALLKITDKDYKPMGKIPFTICEEKLPLGTSIYTLGYPLIETMGESVKLSDGIISSQNGYMGDNNTYQLSAPINPGNSGGPLFNKQGKLVGVINAKYSGAENVAYAIKSKLVKDLIVNNGYSFPKSQNPTFNEKDFVEQVKELEKYVCLIKVY